MTYGLLIDGELVPGARTLDVVDPSTGRAFAVAPRADAAQLERAVAAGRPAFGTWSVLRYAERREMRERSN